jgi:SAM-dependent methyltransferase
MSLSRGTSLHIRNFLDNWLPPVLRDSRPVMVPLLFFAFGRHWRTFADFKPRGFALTEAEFTEAYSRTHEVSQVQGETDLNDACVDAILRNVVGSSVLDAGCGRGYLAQRLGGVVGDVTGCDLVQDDAWPDIAATFQVGSVEALPFEDDSFDTVVCTHTLEHVQRIGVALAELRRVARRRLIVVVPRERPYRYSFNMHLHFFPYEWNWHAVAGAVPGARLEDLGDWFYVEELKA